MSGELWLATTESNTPYNSAPEAEEEQDQEKFSIPPLTDQNAHDMIKHLIRDARASDNPGGSWPFKDKAVLAVEEANRENPRALVRTFARALEQAAMRGEEPPISNQTLYDAQEPVMEPPQGQTGNSPDPKAAPQEP